MELSAYLAKTRGRGAELARRLDIPPAWLSQMAAGRRPVPPPIVPGLEELTGYAVRRWDLRPTDWHRIWPELIGTDGAPDVPDAAPEPITQPGVLDAA